MNQAILKKRSLTAALSAFLVTSIFSQPTQAALRIWDGNGDNSNWGFTSLSGNTNWTADSLSPLPVSGDNLMFVGSANLFTNNDLSGLSIAGINYTPDSGAFMLGGNAITHTGNIVNGSSYTQTILMPIVIGVDQLWTGGPGLNVFNEVTLGNHSLSLQSNVTIDSHNAAFIVAATGNAALTLESGSKLKSLQGIIGDTTGSNGSVTVKDAGSEWINDTNLLVGNAGNGSLLIENGAKVSGKSGYIALPGGAGSVAVSGVNSLWANSQDLFVGDYGIGTLKIGSGGKVTSVDAYIGARNWINTDGTTVFGNGVVTVENNGSQLINSGQFNLGFSGNGTLNILTGGFVHSASAVLGAQIQGEGTATVSDAWSNWLIDTDLKIGDAGKGTLSILAGGVVHSATGVLGAQSGGVGNVAIKGAFSNWMIDSGLKIGDAGIGTLNIETGGLLQNTIGIIGNQAGSSGFVTVTDTGSRWINAAYLSIGTSGTGALTINNGGQVFNSYGYLGASPGGKGTVTVTGANSIWTNNYDLTVGQIGSGTLNIENGGKVSNIQGTVGDFGIGILNIKTGSLLQDSVGIIGNHAGSTGSVTVSDAFSKWINSGNLSVGVAGTGSLTINNGANVFNSDGYLGTLAGGEGTATVAHANSLWVNNGTLTVGQNGSGILNIENGGKVGNTVGMVGDLFSGTGNVTVTGIGSLWGNSKDLTIGNSGTGVLRIEAGGQVSDRSDLILNAAAVLGSSVLSNGSAIVTGTASQWTNNGGLVIGKYGTGNLRVENGGTVINNVGSLGEFASGTGSASVSGNNSRWINSANLIVGEKGSGQLSIYAGGQVSNQIGVLGGFGKGTATVTGTGSEWNNSSYLAIGDNGDGALSIENGAKVTNSIGYLGQSVNGIGRVKVTGANTSWINSNNLYIGLDLATIGTLNVENGGQVRNVDGYLGGTGAAGTFSTSSGTAIVTGANSQWLNSGNLTVGQHGIGTLLVQNQGLVSVGGDAFVDQGNGSGTVTVQSGGIFDVAGTLNIGDQGKVILNGGELAYGARNITSGGEFNWLSGTVTLNNAYLLGADNWLNGLTLNPGKGLRSKQALTIGDYAGITLNGGQLTAESLHVATTGNLDWQRGRLTLGSLRLGDTDTGFGDYLQLNANKALAVTDLSIGSAATLDIGGGATPTVTQNLKVEGVMALASGRLAVTNQVSVAAGGAISLTNAATSRLAAGGGIVNNGTVEGSGRLEGNVQNLSGGKLLLQNSQLTVTGTVNNVAGARIEGQGTLNTGGINNLGLMTFSSGHTDIRGALTLIGPDSRIVNSGGSVLSFYDTVIHNGQEIRTGTGAQTIFFANVSGAGGFAGDGLVAFEGGYNPGNSPAAIDFHGGDISFNSTSVLTMEIFGNTPGSEYDQLLNIDHLDFNGTLALVFGGAFTPTAGSSFNLFDFTSFSGSFAPGRITVTGLDRNLLDFSSLASNGKLQVAAVPLPAGVWLFLGGLMGLLALGQRRKA
ncbi:MAG: hypothetical protein ABL925_00530 [Methylococcales bacterium]